MRDLGINPASIAPWFSECRQSSYVLVCVSDEHAAAWAKVLGAPVRRCYIDDALLDKRAAETGCPKSELVAAKLPDRGSTMAGDFGEILVFLYHSAREPGVEFIGPKKWRLKQDRTKPAPYSDVIQFVLPHWPKPSTDDRILCSEVKTKSTAGNSSPINSAIADCEKDRTSRLAKTLVWLKERALYEDLGTTTLAHLERFTKATDYPEAQKQFRAVAVVCASLVGDVLADAPEEEPTDYTVVVISVPQLKQRYEDVYNAVHATVAEPGGAT
ncbi:Hachiman antiphage defense system protein HamA [Oceanithermus desulfurans]|nr:Hachiman antiphage defense system protein HamA [Oceanithermus desulfurans]